MQHAQRQNKKSGIPETCPSLKPSTSYFVFCNPMDLPATCSKSGDMEEKEREATHISLFSHQLDKDRAMVE